jgi:hypothetical protein
VLVIALLIVGINGIIAMILPYAPRAIRSRCAGAADRLGRGLHQGRRA